MRSQTAADRREFAIRVIEEKADVPALAESDEPKPPKGMARTSVPSA